MSDRLCTSLLVEFYVLLAVHLITVFVNKQLDAQFFFLLFVYSNSLHVSSNQVLIIRRVNCINTISGDRMVCGLSLRTVRSVTLCR